MIKRWQTRQIKIETAFLQTCPFRINVHESTGMILLHILDSPFPIRVENRPHWLGPNSSVTIFIGLFLRFSDQFFFFISREMGS